MPSPTTWTRLEPRFRDRELRDSLAATVHDPLWFLGRQWQLGEFQGEDAGTPISADLSLEIHPLTRYRLGPDGPVEPYRTGGEDPSPPLETAVEAETVRPDPTGVPDDRERNLRLAVEAGEHFRRLLTADGLSYGPTDFAGADLSGFPDVDSLLLEPDAVRVDVAGERYLGVVGGRTLDGDALYRAFDHSLEAQGGGDGGPDLPLPDPEPTDTDLTAYREAAERYRDWYEDLYTEPGDLAGDAEAWDDDRLEYDFAVGVGEAGDHTVFAADEYRGGRLDWYSFTYRTGESLPLPFEWLFDPRRRLDAEAIRRWLEDRDSLPLFPDGGPNIADMAISNVASDGGDEGVGEGSAVPTIDLSVTPTSLRYKGMPSPRWWELEDSQVNLEEIDAGPEDLSRLLLLEFALLYGNDWFEVPIDVPIGSLATVSEFTVYDTFDRRTDVEHTSTAEAAATTDDPWTVFDFDLGDEHGLFLPPVLADSLEADPVEEIQFLRDELVNVAWAIEEAVEGSTGRRLDRHERYQEREPTANDERFVLPNPSVADARYRLATGVPDYWLPLLPVQDATHQVRLRLGRLLDGDAGNAEPWGRVLSATDVAVPEEEVPQSGTAIRRSYQVARWLDGSTHIWSGRRKDPGRGEGSSGLSFDGMEELDGPPVVPDGPLAIVVLQSRPPGPGPEQLNEEYLVLQNVSDREVDLDGWTITDAADHRYTFFDVTLSPDETVTLRTGDGSDAETAGGYVQYWGSGRPIWNDAADEVRVYDDSEALVLRLSYPDVSRIPEGPISIAELHVDATDDDYLTLNDEYIVLENTDDDASVDLGGWRVRDIAGHEYTFPDDGLTVLDPGEAVTLRTGFGIDDTDTRFWGSTRPVWNNTDDAVLVFDSAGTIVAGQVY